MIKQLLSAFVFLFSGVYAIAQQQAVYSSFILNDYFYNPAIAGSKDVLIAAVGYRNQWMGFEGAPVNVNARFFGSLKNQAKHGYGVSFINEKAGITNKTAAYLNYAYHIKLFDNLKLGLGIRPGYMQYSVKLYDARVADQGDDVLTGSVYSANALDVNSGFNLYGKNFFLMGSFNHLLGKSIRFTSYNSSLAFHYNLITGYTFRFKKRNFELQPSVMLKYSRPLPYQWTGMLKASFNNKFWCALIYRSDDAAGMALGMTFKNRFTIGYGYDYTLFGLRQHQTGSHEIMLSFVITTKKPSLDDEDEKLNKSIMDDQQKKNEENKPVEEKKADAATEISNY